MLSPAEVTAEYDAVITKLLEELRHTDPAGEEYANIVDKVIKMEKLRDSNRPRRPSPDVLVNSAASLIGIGLILFYERADVITSKALGFVTKPR